MEIYIFFNSFRTLSLVVGFNWNLVVMFKPLQKIFTESISYLFGGGGSFCSNVLAKLIKNVWKTFEMDFGLYLTTLSPLREFIVVMETLFGNPNAFRIF